MASADDQASPRIALGLDAAGNGDPKGLAVFLNFVERELYSIAYLGGMPSEIKERVIDLHRQTERASEFVAGFNAGHKLSVA